MVSQSQSTADCTPVGAPSAAPRTLLASGLAKVPKIDVSLTCSVKERCQTSNYLRHVFFIPVRFAISVKHTQKQFTAFMKVPIRELCDKLQEIARKRPSSSKSSLRLKTGTQKVEGLWSALKRQLRAVGVRHAPKYADDWAMTAIFLMDNPGFANPGEALREYVEVCVAEERTPFED